MEQLKKHGSKFILCFITGIIVGILMGVVGLSILISYKLDMYYKRVTYLENTIMDKDSRLAKIEKLINTNKFVLKDIEVFLLFNEDEIDKIEIEKNIKGKYSGLLGKEVKSIDADIISEVIDKRIFKLEDKEYKLQVDKIVLTDVMKIWVKVEIVE